MRHRLITTAAAGAAIAAIVSGCSGQNAADPSTASPGRPELATSAPPAGRAPVPDYAPPGGVAHSRWLPHYTHTLLRTEDPIGAGPEIALRFLRGLEDGDYLDAAQQLSAGERLTLALHSRRWLQHVMTDVTTNAVLAAAGRCHRAEWADSEAAVVTCGTQQVVVHVRSGLAPGVQIASYFPHDDVYLGPHTHAYTRFDI